MFESSASILSSISTVPSKVLDSMKMISETKKKKKKKKRAKD